MSYYRRIVAALILSASSMISVGQSRIRSWSYDAVAPDSVDVEYYSKKNFAQAALTVAGLNTAVWGVDHFIQKADYADISLNTIKENFKHGFIWDNDRLGTNMFLHPYHGNLYYNAARSNGFNFWQSGLFALGGSAMWELFMESEYPSTNDIIATPIGGVAIGEVLYRASDLVVKDNSRGWERFGREAGIFLLSPMRGLTRIINGDAWHYRPTTGRVFGIPPITIEVSTGIRMIEFKDKLLDKGAGMTAEINIEYGDRFEPKSSSPYDYFRMHLNLNAQASQPVLGQLKILGRLLSRDIMDDNKNVMSLGLYQHFDFYDSDTISSKTNEIPYKLGIPASIGVGLLYKHEPNQTWAIDAHSHINAIILGGILTDHYRIKDRDYNMGSGFSVKTGININHKQDKFSFSIDYDFYKMYTWGYPRGKDIMSENSRTLNSEGDESSAFFGIGSVRMDYKVAKSLWLTGCFTHYLRNTDYRDFPDVKSSTYSARLMLTYRF